MKCFFKTLIIFMIYVTSASATCDSSSAVVSAYMKQIMILQQYYTELQQKISGFSNEFSNFSKNYNESLPRRNTQLELAKSRVVKTMEQKKIIADILEISQPLTTPIKIETTLNEQKINN